ncbi:MAG: TetR/AcrR family transcriptional regulator [Verrucomicrobiota bacterium]
MSILTRKQREWAERTQLIIREADRLLAAGGYLGLNLDELAATIEYSKATIYNHFKNKEDLVLAVAVDHFRRRAEYFARALTHDGPPRERMCAIGIADEVLAHHICNGFEVMQLARTKSLWEKTAEAQQLGWQEASAQCMGTCYEIMAQARACGDLAPDGPNDETIVMGLISLSKGSHLLSEGLPLFEGMNDVTPESVRFRNYDFYLDGVGWKPLSPDHDYDAIRPAIRDALFPDAEQPV